MPPDPANGSQQPDRTTDHRQQHEDKHTCDWVAPGRGCFEQAKQLELQIFGVFGIGLRQGRLLFLTKKKNERLAKQVTVNRGGLTRAFRSRFPKRPE